MLTSEPYKTSYRTADECGSATRDYWLSVNPYSVMLPVAKREVATLVASEKH